MNDASDVMNALSRRGYQRIIYGSSGVVYGDESEIPCRIDMPVIANDVYSQSKLFNEKIVLDAGGIAVRIANLFGEGMSANNVMSDIIRQVPGEGPLRVRDDKPVRDYLHVSDAATAIGMLIDGSYCGLMNIGSGIGTSVRSLAEFALAVAGQSTREIIATAPVSKRSTNVLDISETRKILDWAPAASLQEQLTRLINNKEQLAHE
jgi:UDP-glucose 4-epimerase